MNSVSRHHAEQEIMLCINPSCCPIVDCSMRHHEGRVVSKILTVCPDFPGCSRTKCALYHPSRTSLSPMNALCESLIFAVAEFLDIRDTLSLYSSSSSVYKNRRAVLFSRDIRFFRRQNSMFWEPCKTIYMRPMNRGKKKSVLVVVEDTNYTHHRSEVSSVHEWGKRFSRDEPFPRLIRRDGSKTVCDLGRRRDFRPDRLEIGTRVDAMDQDGVWYEAVVADMSGGQTRIHFDGWDARFDAWLPARSPAIAIHNTFTPAGWRERLKVGQDVEFRKDSLWHQGKILERTSDRIVVGNHRSSMEIMVSDRRVSLPGCHIFNRNGRYEYRRDHFLLAVLHRWLPGDRSIRVSKTTGCGYELFFA